MLRPGVDTLRLFLHVLAATVWVGGQLTLAGLVPGLRDLSASAPRVVARRFNQIAWPSLAVLVVTGLWNVASVSHPFRGPYGRHSSSRLGLLVSRGSRRGCTPGPAAVLRLQFGEPSQDSARSAHCSSACCWQDDSDG
jgi:hypothetical protein